MAISQQQPDYSGEMLPDQGMLKKPLCSSIRTFLPTSARWKSNELTWKSSLVLRGRHEATVRV